MTKPNSPTSDVDRGHLNLIERNRFLYMFANVGGHVYILITLPLLTSHLNPTEFGFYIILVQIITITQAVNLTLFSSTLLRFYYDYGEQERREFLGTIVTSFMSLQILFAFVLFILRHYWLKVLFPNITIEIDPYVLYAMVWMVLISLRGLITTFIKVLERPALVWIQVLVYGALLVILLFVLVVNYNRGLLGALQSLVLAEFGTLLFLIKYLRGYAKISWNIQHIKKVLLFSSPLAASSLLFIVFGNVDRMVLSRHISLADMGEYGIGFLVGNIAALMVTAHVSAYSPRMLSVLRTEGQVAASQIAGYFMRDSLALMGIIVGGLTVLNDVIVYLVGNVMFHLSFVVLGIASGHLMRSQFLFFRQAMFSKNHTIVILLFNFLLLFLGILVANLLVRAIGMSGVAFMSMISHALILPLAYLVTKSYFPIRISITASLCSLALIGLLVFLEYSLDSFGRSFLSLEYWGLKFLEVLVVLILYGKYATTLVKKFITQ